jgi:hypothetical protein
MTDPLLDRHEWLSFEDPEEERTWLFDVTFLLSRWTCIFGSGCQGVLTEDASDMVQGCCSYGAHFTGKADRDRVKKAAATLTPDQWQFHDLGRKGGVVEKQDDGTWISTQADDACIFLNRPGFPGGPGCALHRAALERGERPLDLKPEVCWQLPLRRVDSTDENGHVTSTLREWKRRDWGEGGEEFHWWCTEAAEAFTGETTVLVSMRDEIIEMIGEPIYDLLVEAVIERAANGAPLLHPSVPVPTPKRRQRA